MNNDYLVDLVRDCEYYLSCKSPRDVKVLEAMRRVDRREFLGTEPLDAYLADPECLQNLRRDLNKFQMEGLKDISPLIISPVINSANGLLMSIVKLVLTSRDLAYSDIPLPIGHGQTCSQPSLVGYMADILELGEGMRVLEIGTGCGYSAAITFHLIGDKGYLATVESIPGLADSSRRNLQTHFGGGNINRRLEVLTEDGSVGLERLAPFDRIYLTAGVSSAFDPTLLARQLKPEGGILLYPPTFGCLHKMVYQDGKLQNASSSQPFVQFVQLQGKNP